MSPGFVPDEKTIRILRRSRLFAGLDDAGIVRALDFFRASPEDCAQGTFLSRSGVPLTHFGLVTSGIVQVYMDDINGDQMIMASVSCGETFGESLCFLRLPETPVYICAATDVSLIWLGADAVRDGAFDAWSRDLVNRFISMLAERTLNMNNRIQVLSKITLREKLVAFFTEYSHKSGSSTFSIPFDRRSMASYLGTERSALSRELSRMKADGIIDFYKNSFRLIGRGD